MIMARAPDGLDTKLAGVHDLCQSIKPPSACGLQLVAK
jgi:hypothetical protein